MRIKAFLFALLSGTVAGAQEVADHWYFDVQAGVAQTFGKMTTTNPGILKYNGLASFQLGFSKYGSTGVGFAKGVIGVQFGWLFHYNHLDPSDLENITPKPVSIDYHKRNQMLQGPWLRFEYTTNTRVAPFIGVGANLLAVRGARFDLNFDPKDNYFKQVQYTTSGWGTLNPAFTGSAGLRVTMPGNWCLAIQYQLFLRDAWTINYKLKAIPATLDNPEEDRNNQLIQKGWNQHIEFKVQFPLK